MAAADTFHYDIEYSQLDPSQARDSRGNKITTIRCHGRLVAETREKLEGIFKDTAFHGHIYFDLGDVSYLDSAGLGALIRLKVSAMKESSVSLTFVEMGPRVMQLLKIAHLLEWINS
jgi:anti-sigma B factor antagonist